MSFNLETIKSLLKNAAEKPGLSNSEGEQPAQDELPIRGLSELYVPEQSDEEDNCDDLAAVLCEMGKLSKAQLAGIRAEKSGHSGMDTERLLKHRGLVNDQDIIKAKARLYEFEYMEIDPKQVDADVFSRLSEDVITESGIIAVALEEEVVVVATSEPGNVFAIGDVKRHLGSDIRVVVSSADNIKAVCQRFMSGGSESKSKSEELNIDDLISDMSDVTVVEDKKEEFEDIEKMAGESPVIKFVNYIISNAINSGASDIHIEPKAKMTKIRYRIDGMLFDSRQAPSNMHCAIVSRIKIMANLDISERRLPQDGKISVIVGGRGIDLRISTLPMNHGEKVVIRVLDSKSISLGLEKLGMESDVREKFKAQISLPHGIFLVTGPTGSGKSTTLYSALGEMDHEKLNLSTVEDPVEYELEYCNQVQVLDKIGLTFASALRSLLRQDPDIIMIGEIRDNETARIAVQSALTGHLVLSTLHTNDAPSSITRLVDIGIDPYLIATAVNAILAQRLVRKICDNCKEVYEVSENMLKYLMVERSGGDKFYHGAGCDKCRNSGYSGRIGIYELLVLDEKFHKVINTDPTADNMRRCFHESGVDSLFDDGIKKVKKGLTTIEEVLRVTEVYGKTAEEVFVENT